MALSLIVLKENAGETRVAATPETVKKLKTLGIGIMFEAGAGIVSGFDDAAYKQAGASIVKTATAIRAALKKADLVLAVRPPAPRALKQ